MIKSSPDDGGGPVNLITWFGAKGAAAELRMMLGVPVRASEYELDPDPTTGELRVWP